MVIFNKFGIRSFVTFYFPVPDMSQVKMKAAIKQKTQIDNCHFTFENTLTTLRRPARCFVTENNL